LHEIVFDQRKIPTEVQERGAEPWDINGN